MAIATIWEIGLKYRVLSNDRDAIFRENGLKYEDDYRSAVYMSSFGPAAHVLCVCEQQVFAFNFDRF